MNLAFSDVFTRTAFTCCYLHTLCNTDPVTTNHAKKLLKLSREQGILRPRDLQPAGIPRVYLKQLVDQGRGHC